MKIPNNVFNKVIKACYIFIIALIIFSGCAKKEAVKNITDEEVLRARVAEYWNYVMKEDFVKSYDYEDLLFQKSVSTMRYIKMHTEAFKIKDVKINGISLDGNSGVADITVKVEIHAPGVKPLVTDSARKDRWGKIDGIWYHVSEKYSGKQGAKGN